MFGLPATTNLVLWGFPLFWILYTVIFLIKTKDWAKEDKDKGGER